MTHEETKRLTIAIFGEQAWDDRLIEPATEHHWSECPMYDDYGQLCATCKADHCTDELDSKYDLLRGN